eukprot:SAG31_NODE_7718_length_1610_cov_1.040371_2_plen_146_part_00
MRVQPYPPTHSPLFSWKSPNHCYVLARMAVSPEEKLSLRTCLVRLTENTEAALQLCQEAIDQHRQDRSIEELHACTVERARKALETQQHEQVICWLRETLKLMDAESSSSHTAAIYRAIAYSALQLKDISQAVRTLVCCKHTAKA